MTVEAYVWWCGDEFCDCHQARIESVVPSRFAGIDDRTTLWEGKFYSDGEEGAHAELNRVGKRMRKVWNDAYHQIRWPWLSLPPTGN